MKSEFQDHYYILGIPPDATAANIKTRYRSLSKTHHPDHGGSQAAMAKLNLAYAILSNPFKRSIFDAERRRHFDLLSPEISRTTSPQRNHTTHPVSRTARASQSAGKRGWWPKIAMGFASIIILGGILLQLPVAEALHTPSEAPSTTAKPLEIAYPPAYVPPVQTAQDNTTAGQEPTTHPEAAPTSLPTSNDKQAGSFSDKREQLLREFCAVAVRNRLCTDSTRVRSEQGE